MTRAVTILTIVLVGSLLAPPTTAAQPVKRVEYYHLDALGSVRAVTDQQGHEIARHDYLPFGEEWPQPTFKLTPLFTGKQRDAESDLDYFEARYYASRSGRFTTVDPLVAWPSALQDPQLWNRYAYVRNSPMRHTDPDGRCIWDFCAGESAAVWAAGATAAALTGWMLSPEGRAKTQAVVEASGALIVRSGEALIAALSQFAKPADPFAQERTKLWHIKDHLTPQDIEGAQRDLAGNPVVGPHGRPFQHLKEVRDAQQGLLRLIAQLKARIASGKLTKDELAEAQRLLGEASRTLDRSEQLVPQR